MTEIKCDKCGNTGLTLLSSKIEGLDRVIDIYFCRKCQQSKIVSTLKNQEPTSDTNIEPIDVPIPDIDEPEYEEVLDEPENPYEDTYDGWDPNIG
jgi:hypothetical protein